MDLQMLGEVKYIHADRQPKISTATGVEKVSIQQQQGGQGVILPCIIFQG